MKKENKSKKVDLVFLASCFAIVLCLLIGSFLINASSEKTREYGKMLLEKEEILKQINVVRLELYSLSSINVVLQTADQKIVNDISNE